MTAVTEQWASDGEVPRVSINRERLGFLVSATRANLAGKTVPIPLVDTLPCHPAAGHPLALEFYVLTILHQFGFWLLDDDSYGGAWYGMHHGARLRGSSFVWARMSSLLTAAPETFRLDGDVDLEPVECVALLDDRQGTPPLFDRHLELSRGLRAEISGYGLRKVLRKLDEARERAEGFVALFGGLPGYSEDPHRKKLHLLYMYLTWRSDNPVGLSPNAIVAPAVDYHLMRVLLRFGAVRIDDAGLSERLRDRVEVAPSEAAAVRAACVDAVAQLIAATGAASFAVDQFLFGLRSHCGETPEGPDCESCVLRRKCDRRIELFQPLVREIVWY